MERLLFFIVLLWSFFICTTASGGKEPQGSQREQYFRCQGQEYIDTLASGVPAKTLLQINSKTIRVTGAFMFTDAEISIVSETNTEIIFDYRTSGTTLGCFGVFNKTTGHLRADANHGEPQKATHHTWGEYECKPVKF